MNRDPYIKLISNILLSAYNDLRRKKVADVYREDAIWFYKSRTAEYYCMVINVDFTAWKESCEKFIRRNNEREEIKKVEKDNRKEQGFKRTSKAKSL